MSLTDPTTVTERYGRDSYALIQPETTYGVVPDDFYTNAYYVDLSGETLQQERANLFSSGVHGTGYRYTRVVSHAAGVSVGGDFLTDLQYAGYEWLIYGALGGYGYSQPNAASSPDVYAHGFYPQADLPSFTVEIGKGSAANTAFRYTGIMVNSMTLGVSADGFMTATFGLIGKDVSRLDPTNPVMVHRQLITSTHLVKFRLLDLESQYQKDLNSIVGYALSVNNNLTNDRRFLGSNLIRKPQRSEKRKVTGRVVMESGDEILDAVTSFQAGTRHRLQLYFQGTAIDSYSTFSMEIQTHRTELRGSLPNIASMGRQHVDMPFDCYEWNYEGIGGYWDYEMFLILVNDRAPLITPVSNPGTPDSDPET